MTDTPPPPADQPKPETPAVKAKKKRTRLQVAGLIVERSGRLPLLPLLARMETSPLTIERVDPGSPLFRFIG